MKKTIGVLALALAFAGVGYAQETEDPFKISGYAEVYYQFQGVNSKTNARPEFVYSHNRANEVNLNLGYLQGAYATEYFRANLALGFGTYMNSNYAAEPGVLKNLYQANVGVRLSKNHNLWIDAGVMPSHIGFESAEGVNCFTLTRSIMADNSPYFETGAKLSYTTSDNVLEMTFLILNGWQRIEKPDGNTWPAFGHQLTYRPSDKITLNSSSFIGNEQSDAATKMRYFHNLYGQFQLTDKFSLIAGFDIGAQQASKNSDDYHWWYTSAIIGSYQATENVRLALRAEYFNDKYGVIVATSTPNGFETFGGSLNVDYQLFKNVVWRTEIKNLTSTDAIYNHQNQASKNSAMILTALAVQF